MSSKRRAGFLTVVCLTGLAVAGSVQAQIVAQIPGPDGPWDYASYDPVGKRVLISRGDGVMALDVATRKLTKLASGNLVNGSIVLPDGRLLITNETSSTVTLANGTTGAILATIPVGKAPDAALFDPASGLAFVMNNESGDASAIDLKAGKEAARIKVGGVLEFAVVDGKGKLFVNVEDKGEIAVLDTKTLKVSAHYKMKGCVEPSGLAYAPPYNLLISSCSNGHAKVIDAATGAQVADIPVGPHPDAVIYDQARGVAYIPSAGSLAKDGEITVLKVAGAKAVTLARRIPTQRGARTGAEDPTTGLLYLPTATYVLKAGAPTTAPGTFRVLIVDPASSPAARK